MQGFDPSKVPTDYGDQLYVWDWTTRQLTQKVRPGRPGLAGTRCTICTGAALCVAIV